jgi:LacI family transcriptional regulator
VLSGKQRTVGIAEETRLRIMRAAEELHYSPNHLARGLKTSRNYTLGVSFFYDDPAWLISDHYGTCLLKGILNAASNYDYNITHFHRRWHDSRTSASEFRGRGMDGFLIIAPEPKSEMVAGLVEIGVPLVVISASAEECEAPSVAVDNARGTRLAIEHLLALGHRRVAHFMDPIDDFDNVSRRDAYLAVLDEAGISFAPHYLAAIPQDDELVEAAKRLLAMPDRPTAIFAHNDVRAIGILHAARELGIRVPEDLSIIGFDDIPSASATTPPLTTVRQPLTEMAVKATELLIAVVEGEEVATETHWFEPELIVRGSTMPV